MKGFSRRAQRKQERLEKKQKRNHFFQQKKNKVSTENFNKPQIVDSNDPVSKENVKRKRKPKSNKPKRSRIEVERDRRQIREEEKSIKKYEKLLKLKTYTKRKRLPKSFYLDGLGELIEICDGKQYENRLELDDDIDIDDAIRNPKKYKTTTILNDDVSDLDDDVENEEMSEMEDGFTDEEHVGEDSVEEDDESSDEIVLQPKKKIRTFNKDGNYEDIYGFIRDKDGNIVKSTETNCKQINTISTKDQFLNAEVVVDEPLQRRLRGLLNRLTSDNIKVISKEIMNLYKTNSRAVVNQGILNCLEKTIFNVEYNVPSKLVSELSLLIAILYSEMGEEVGAFFIHIAICRFDQLCKEPKKWNSSKQIDNLIVFILNIYTTGLMDSAIVYDILDRLCEQIANEKAIELIDMALKASGFLLRKDDPLKMKTLILSIQQLTSTIDLDGLSGTRIKFILDSLTAIKNNNLSKLKISEPVVMNELIESTMKATIKKNRVPFIPGQYATVIQSAHWFSFTKTIIPLESINAKHDNDEDQEPTIIDDQQIDYRLRDQLCRALRINTPLRKDLFTALLQCNDYIDATSKLIRIGKKQFSEVINVVLHVALNEKKYNPFYYHLLQHLTTCDRKYKLALDFAIRDKISQAETLSNLCRNNLSKLIFNLLKGSALSITCLKVVQFSDMNEIYVDLIRKIMEPLFSECDDATIESILSKIPKKDSFASAIKLFISCFMSSDSKNRLSSVKQLQFKLKI
ncbi:Nucleolar MIF4G domain-containing protein 1 [Blomia tropicalis]|nr:Nucleolar MIF4G domain-containing protein 1 [Blomia tropicalis]